MLQDILSGAKTGCGKRAGLGEFQYRLLQGLKPNVDLMGFSGPAKAVPLLQSMSEMRFSAACEVVPGHKAFADCTGNEFFRSL